METLETPLSFSRLGEGTRGLVLLHGFLGAGRNLTTLGRRLREREPGLTVVLPDLRGHGDSPPLPAGGTADLGMLAADVLALAGALGLEQPLRIMGHSLGGRVALAAALRAPAGVVGEITLLDIAPGPITVLASDSVKILGLLRSGPREAASREPFRAHLRAGGLAEGLIEWQMLNLKFDAGVYRWRIDAEALTGLHARSNAADLWEAVERRPRGYAVRCVRGGRAPYVSDADAVRLEAAGCPVATLPGVGHFVHVDGLEALLAVLP